MQKIGESAASRVKGKKFRKAIPLLSVVASENAEGYLALGRYLP